MARYQPPAKKAPSKKSAPPAKGGGVCSHCGGKIVGGVCSKCGYKSGGGGRGSRY